LVSKTLKTALTTLVLSSVIFILTGSVYADFGDKVLKKGMTHQDVRVLQEKLSYLGYFEGNEFTNYFGDKTLAALKAFQKDTGLEPDGIAGPNTFKYIEIKIQQQKLIDEGFETLKEGDNGERVKDIEEKLKNLELFDGEPDETFDTDTANAVIKFQAIEGIPQTGEVDQATMIKLHTAAGKKTADRASESRRLVNSKVVEYAKQFLGKPYKWGASSGNAFDCSGFVLYVMKKFNVNLDRTASGQFNNGTKVERSDLQPGDLVFFTTYKKGPSHVGVYIGDDKFIHASSTQKKVVITDMNSSYYKKRYLGARRYELTASD